MTLSRLFLALALILTLPIASEAADVTLAWDSNVEEDVAGYEVAYGTASGNYTAVVDVGNATSHRLFNLESNRTYFFAVRAYNFQGTASTFSSEVSTTTAGSALLLTSVSMSQSSPKPVGTQVLFSANAAGGIQPYQYKWFVGDAQSRMMVRDWSTDATFRWQPSTAGSYQITAWVRNGNSTADAAANGSSSMAVPFTIERASVVYPVSITFLAADLPSPQRVGTAIRFTARAAGGVAPRQFRWLVSAGQGWIVAKDWSASNSLTWTPTSAGLLVVRPQVRSATNTSDTPDAQHMMMITILP